MMTAPQLRLYHRLPSSLKNVAATLHGYRLKSWRYSSDTERLVVEALERETWSAEQWSTFQNTKLTNLLTFAAKQVPYYSTQWVHRGVEQNAQPLTDLTNWPILDKTPLRTQPRAFLARNCNPRQMYEEHTSGTTGTPLTLWQSRDCLVEWYALYEARCRRWYGVSRDDSWAILGGQLVIPVTENHPPYWVWNYAMRQLYLSTYHLTIANARLYFDIMRRRKIKYLLGYTSALHTLASAALEQNLQPPELTVAVTNAEPVLEHQRQLITRAFGCPLRETYGMSELAVAASECESGRLHLWPEVGCVEVMQDGSPLQPGNTGDLIATGLLNQGMPLIRYRVGDRIRLARDGATCPCGRTLPLLESLEGRCDDVLVTSDGRLVGRLDSVFKSDFPIREAQIVQDRVDQVTVLVVPAQGFTAAVANHLSRRLRQRLGAVHVKIQQVESIPRDANGKFRAVVCRIPAPNSRSSSRPGLSNG